MDYLPIIPGRCANVGGKAVMGIGEGAACVVGGFGAAWGGGAGLRVAGAPGLGPDATGAPEAGLGPLEPAGFLMVAPLFDPSSRVALSPPPFLNVIFIEILSISSMNDDQNRS